jgi:prepilin-type N-terminal cleavage/methylation domain-containing protein
MIKSLFKKSQISKPSKAFSLKELSIVVLIIGILIAGVTQGSRLVRQSRLSTAQNQRECP